MRGSGVGDMLSGTFRVWSKNFVSFFLVYLVLAAITGAAGVALALAIIGTFAPTSVIPGAPSVSVTGADIVRLLLLAAAALVASAIIGSVVAGGMTEFAVRRFRGESMTVKQALRRGFQRFLSILGANVFLTLILVALLIVPLGLIIASVFEIGSVPTGSGIALLCGGLVALVVGGVLAIYVSVALSLYAPAIMMEGVGAIDGLRRSWAITRGHRLSLFGAIFAIAILAGVITGAITTPASFARFWVVSLVASALASALVAPWSVILAAVAYDLIVRPFPAVPAQQPMPMVPVPPPTGPPPGP